MMSKPDFLKELEHIHNKVIFDAFSEALDAFRVFGLKGRPFPWKINSFKLSDKPIKNKDISNILRKTSEKVLEWSASLCGIMFDKEDSPLTPGIVLDEEYIA